MAQRVSGEERTYPNAPALAQNFDLSIQDRQMSARQVLVLLASKTTLACHGREFRAACVKLGQLSVACKPTRDDRLVKVRRAVVT